MNLIENDRDFASGPFNVTFHAGETVAMFNVSINDDNTVENNETFAILIDQSSLPNGVSIGNPSRTVVIIVDDDCE